MLSGVLPVFEPSVAMATLHEVEKVLDTLPDDAQHSEVRPEKARADGSARLGEVGAQADAVARTALDDAAGSDALCVPPLPQDVLHI